MAPTVNVDAHLSLSKPLSTQEEIRLSTCANFLTLALFRPLDTYRTALNRKRQTGSVNFGSLWNGWPKQALNKAVDDEIFNANIQRVTKFVEQTFNIKNPGAQPTGKAAIGVMARALTLGFMIPYQTVMDPTRRRKAFEELGSGKGLNMVLPVMPLYRGFERSLIKESVFTSSYILGSAYFGTIYGRQRERISAYLLKVYPSLKENEVKQKRYTEIAIASLKGASAGALASILAGPIDMAGKNIPVMRQISTIGRKAIRKGCYNGINSIVVQSLYATKIHRRILLELLPTSLDVVAAEAKED